MLRAPSGQGISAMRYQIAIRWVLVVWLLASSTWVGASDWKNTLKETLESSYPLTKRATLSPDRITQQGVILVINKAGIAADPSSDLRYSETFVRNGAVGEQGGATSAVFSKENTRVFKPGERVYVTDIKVGDDHVMLLLLSLDMFDVVKKGSTKQTRYKGALIFKFDNGYLSTADPAKIKQAISEVVSTEAEAATANTKTIELGQTPEQVETILGKPGKIVNLGQKITYIYPDMKVVFVDGKVADVQ